MLMLGILLDKLRQVGIVMTDTAGVILLLGFEFDMS